MASAGARSSSEVPRSGSASPRVGLVGARVIEKRDAQRTLYDKGAFPTPGSPKVAVVKAAGYDDGLQATVKGGLESVGADVSGKSVLLSRTSSSSTRARASTPILGWCSRRARVSRHGREVRHRR